MLATEITATTGSTYRLQLHQLLMNCSRRILGFGEMGGLDRNRKSKRSE